MFSFSRLVRRSTLILSLSVPSGPHQPHGDHDGHDDDQDHEDDQEVVGQTHSVVSGDHRRGSAGGHGDGSAGCQGESIVGHVGCNGDGSAVLDGLSVEGDDSVTGIVAGVGCDADCVRADGQSELKVGVVLESEVGDGEFGTGTDCEVG